MGWRGGGRESANNLSAISSDLMCEHSSTPGLQYHAFLSIYSIVFHLIDFLYNYVFYTLICMYCFNGTGESS